MSRAVITRKVKRGSGQEEEFDLEFWRNMEPEKKFAAAWEMVNEIALIRGGGNVGQSRLQRSVQTIKRRSG